jgi:hypothetical protein
MDMLPGGQMNFPSRARQRVQTFAADQLHTTSVETLLQVYGHHHPDYQRQAAENITS